MNITNVYETLVRPLETAAAVLIESAVDVFSRNPAQLTHYDIEPRGLEDLFAHPDVQTEWWYYTGHCTTESGRNFGFEFVFFKRRTDLDSLGIFPVRALANPMYFAHFAITDIAGETFKYEHIRSFDKPFDLPVQMSESRYYLWLGDWTIRELDGDHLLHATLGPGLVFDARLQTGKPLVLNGDGSGISRKTTGASAHFSFTRMPVEGQLTVGSSREQFTGSAWMDREFGTWEQTDWDWFSVQLTDGTELMIYQFRSITCDSTGTFVDREGNCIYLGSDDYQITVKSVWVSPRTGTEYPSGWHISVPRLKLEIDIEPVLRDQELDTRGTTMIIYWEGACAVTGKRGRKKVSGKAYVELVGYDRSHENPALADFLFRDPLKRIKQFFN
ncbi:MAG: lipocalin family protein [Pyrinomonadaceae bacterium]